MKRACIVALLSISLLAGVFRTASANDAWPSRPIRLVIPSAPGTGSDLTLRALAQRLSGRIGQPVIVENKPGASGELAARAVQAAAADGYTFLYSTASATVMAQALTPDPRIDFTRDFVPVSVTAIGGVFLLVQPDFPATNLKELIEVVKANPNRYMYGSWAVGSNGHLIMEWLKKRTGMQIEHVPYKNMPTLLTELGTGVIPIGWTDPISSVPFIKSGRLRAIAVSGNERTPQLPNVRTMGEQGYPFPALGWQGLFAPAGTSAAVVRRMHDEMNGVLVEPEVKALYTQMNTAAPPVWPMERFKAMIENDLIVWKKIVRDANVRID